MQENSAAGNGTNGVGGTRIGRGVGNRDARGRGTRGADRGAVEDLSAGTASRGGGAGGGPRGVSRRVRGDGWAVRFRKDHGAQPAGRTDPPFTGEGVDRRPGDIGTSGQGAGESTAFADRICLSILQPAARTDRRGERGVHHAAAGGARAGTPRAGAAAVCGDRAGGARGPEAAEAVGRAAAAGGGGARGAGGSGRWCLPTSPRPTWIRRWPRRCST